MHQLQLHVLGDQVLTSLVEQIHAEIAAQMPQRKLDIAGLETELATVRAEQKRLAKAVALSDEIPELVSELEQRAARIQTLEAQIATARRTLGELRTLVDQVERAVRAGFADLKTALHDHEDRRQIFLSMFPDGLTFTPERTPDGVARFGRSRAPRTSARRRQPGFV